MTQTEDAGRNGTHRRRPGRLRAGGPAAAAAGLVLVVTVVAAATAITRSTTARTGAAVVGPSAAVSSPAAAPAPTPTDVGTLKSLAPAERPPARTPAVRSDPPTAPAPGGGTVTESDGAVPGTLYTVEVTPRGEPFSAGEMALWLPRGVGRVRGLFFDTFMPSEALASTTVRSWRAARAQRHSFGMLFMKLGHREGDKRLLEYRCDLTWPALQRGLAGLAQRSGHPEVASAPFVLEGGSATTYCTNGLTTTLPERIIALDLVAAGVPTACTEPAVAVIPTIVREGTLTGAGTASSGLSRCRAAGMPLAVALQNGRNGHNIKRTSYVDADFVDSVIPRRLGAPGSPLRRVDLATGVLVNHVSEQVSPYTSAPAGHDKSWLPNLCTVTAWRTFRVQPPNGPVSVERPTGCP